MFKICLWIVTSELDALVLLDQYIIDHLLNYAIVNKQKVKRFFNLPRVATCLGGDVKLALLLKFFVHGKLCLVSLIMLPRIELIGRKVFNSCIRSMIVCDIEFRKTQNDNSQTSVNGTKLMNHGKLDLSTESQ